MQNIDNYKLPSSASIENKNAKIICFYVRNAKGIATMILMQREVFVTHIDFKNKQNHKHSFDL